MTSLAIAVMGAGIMGRQHIKALAEREDAHLAALVDPAPEARILAEKLRVPCYAGLGDVPSSARPDGLVIATPTQLHEANALHAFRLGLPVLVDKPIAADADEARRMIAAAKEAGLPLLVGFHRRHSPMWDAAKDLIASGALGRVVAAQAFCWFYKPEPYFDVAWRKQTGAGPTGINLVHDVNLFLHLLGPAVSAQAATSHGVRGFEVEDTAAAILTFASGTIATFTVSDTVSGPWSYELTAGENPAYPKTGQSSHFFGGTEGGLELPRGRLWKNPGALGWWEPIEAQALTFDRPDPLVRQIAQFAAVIRSDEEPKVGGEEARATMIVLDAIRESAATGRRAEIPQ